MITSTTRKLTRFRYAATLLGAFAVVALARPPLTPPTTSPLARQRCHYTDADGYDVPIDNGQDVFDDGKIVSCRDGRVVITTAPAGGEPERAGLEPITLKAIAITRPATQPPTGGGPPLVVFPARRRREIPARGRWG